MYVTGHNTSDYILKVEADGETHECVFHAGDYGNVQELITKVLETVIFDGELDLYGITNIEVERG